MPDLHDAAEQEQETAGFPPVYELIKQAEKTAETVIEKCKKRQVKLALAESCTAGLVSSLLANTNGASCVLWGSFVCYTKEAKTLMLSLDGKDLDKYGLVSGETACKMAESALKKSGADIACAVTGLAGPPDGSGDVPVGTVWIAAASSGGVEPRKFLFNGERNEVRLEAAIAVLKIIDNIVDKN